MMTHAENGTHLMNELIVEMTAIIRGEQSRNTKKRKPTMVSSLVW